MTGQTVHNSTHKCSHDWLIQKLTDDSMMGNNIIKDDHYPTSEFGATTMLILVIVGNNKSTSLGQPPMA
jgi:hypothetical protein